jgi:hypothetical protein
VLILASDVMIQKWKTIELVLIHWRSSQASLCMSFVRVGDYSWPNAWGSCWWYGLIEYDVFDFMTSLMRAAWRTWLFSSWSSVWGTGSRYNCLKKELWEPKACLSFTAPFILGSFWKGILLVRVSFCCMGFW